mmetsp:Transcript_39126/g.63689  ORF Transcript_39126/g.63689 Transcript_39126/m.63689 type:complete len:220 (-) Transcript_39126:56-715(-)
MESWIASSSPRCASPSQLLRMLVCCCPLKQMADKAVIPSVSLRLTLTPASTRRLIVPAVAPFFEARCSTLHPRVLVVAVTSPFMLTKYPIIPCSLGLFAICSIPVQPPSSQAFKSALRSTSSFITLLKSFEIATERTVRPVESHSFGSAFASKARSISSVSPLQALMRNRSLTAFFFFFFTFASPPPFTTSFVPFTSAFSFTTTTSPNWTTFLFKVGLG